jgi:alpha-galactosidase
VVVTTIGVGGRRAWEADVFIPRKYGIYQPVGDTAMPGGISRALRMIPAMIDIARDIGQLAPDALFFNYSNPMTANCWAVRKATGVPVVGLCHGTFHVTRQLAEFAGAPPAQVTSLFAGLNHLTFIFDLRHNGRDLWPDVRARLTHEARTPDAQDVSDAPFGRGFRALDNPFSWSLFDTYGAYPSANDRHVVEFFPERFPGGRYYGKTLGLDVFSFEKTIAAGDRIYAAMREQALGQAPLDERIFERAEGEHEQLLDILDSIWHDRCRLFAVNLPNRNAVPNLPADAVLELPAAATGSGLRAIQLTDFSDTTAAVLARKISSIRLTVEAALMGRRDLVVEALLADGAVSDPDTAAKMTEELLNAHRPYLNRFFSS